MNGFDILDYSNEGNSNHQKINVLRERKNKNIEDNVKLSSSIPLFGSKRKNEENISEKSTLEKENVKISSVGFYLLISIMVFLLTMFVVMLIFTIAKKMGYVNWSFDIMSHFKIDDDDKAIRDLKDKLKRKKNNKKIKSVKINKITEELTDDLESENPLTESYEFLEKEEKLLDTQI